MTTFICHPENAKALRESIMERLAAVEGKPNLSKIGLFIQESEWMPIEQRKKWGWTKYHFPYDRFVEYGDEDLSWMLPLGLDIVEHEMERVYYLIDEEQLPDIADMMEKLR